MLNPFPYVLSFGAFAPLLIRLSVSLFLMLAARHLWQNRQRAVAELLPKLGSLAWPKFYGLLGIEVAAALSLFLGFYTQIGAIAGMVVFLGLPYALKRFPSLSPWTYALPLLLALLSLTLLITGAGIYAFDYPF